MYCLSWKEIKSNKRSSGGVNYVQVGYAWRFTLELRTTLFIFSFLLSLCLLSQLLLTLLILTDVAVWLSSSSATLLIAIWSVAFVSLFYNLLFLFCRLYLSLFSLALSTLTAFAQEVVAVVAKVKERLRFLFSTMAILLSKSHLPESQKLTI